MVRFVICDDESMFVSLYSDIINRLYKESSLEYKIIKFSSYSQEFKKIIEDGSSTKIYILDIELKGLQSGIDIARKIRNVDWNSMIIMITSHYDMGYEALKAQIMLLDFISKFDNLEENFERAVKKAVYKIDDNRKLVFTKDNIVHRVYFDDLLYIVKSNGEKESLFITYYDSFEITISLTELMGMLDDRFFMTHRSCIVNTQKIKTVNWNDSIICFDNGIEINLLSRDRKRGLKEYVNN